MLVKHTVLHLSYSLNFIITSNSTFNDNAIYHRLSNLQYYNTFKT